MAGGAFLHVELPAARSGDRRREHARARHLRRAHVEQARRRIEGRSAPAAAAVEAGEDDGLDADVERHELPVAAEAPERLEHGGVRGGRPPRQHVLGQPLAGEGRRLHRLRLRPATRARRPRRWPGRGAPRSGTAASRWCARRARRSLACSSARRRRRGVRRASPSPAPAAPADRDPRCRDGRSGNATAACPWRRRARAGCWRTGCRRDGRRRRSRRPPIRSARTRCRAPCRPPCRPSCWRRRPRRARRRATSRRRPHRPRGWS